MRTTFYRLTPLLFLFPAAAFASDDPELGPFDVLISAEVDVEVPAQEMGMLVEMSVREGATVKAGQTLARIDDSTARVGVDRARVDLKLAEYKFENDLQVQLAQKALGVAEAELRRAQNANEQKANTVTQTEVERLQFLRDKAELDVDQATRNLREAELTVEQMRSVLALAELAVQRREIVAPISGQVVEVRRQRGEWVQPGETVFTIISTDRVRADALVTVDKVPGDVTGRPVRVMTSTAGRGSEPLKGTIVFVDPRINVINGQYNVRAEIQNPQRRLRPGDRARMTILPPTPAENESANDVSSRNQTPEQ